VIDRRLLLTVGLSLVAVGCALNSRPTLSPDKMAELWQAPADLERRSLFYGAGGPGRAPNPNDEYEFLGAKATGTQPGYDVKDSRGREWSVKMGPEARIEPVVSRILWAVGYHQPSSYYLSSWTLSRDGKKSVQEAGRFRLEPTSPKKVGVWSWRNSPFMGTRPLAGLFVLMVIFNNWDLKSAQNAVYQIGPDGEDAPERYMVRDLGASLGKTAWPTFGNKDNPDEFDREPFILGVEGNRVRFGYQDAWLEPQLHNSVAPDDVRWICELLARLSPKQWRDAFRAGGFTEAEADRYIRRLQEKIAEGLKLGSKS
jgi:hypothetical protein